jgi:hypothetical protein
MAAARNHACTDTAVIGVVVRFRGRIAPLGSAWEELAKYFILTVFAFYDGISTAFQTHLAQQRVLDRWSINEVVCSRRAHRLSISLTINA